MELDRLYGNEQLKTKLSAMFRQNRISHSWLITGPEGSGRHTAATIIAAAMECEGGADRPCGVCRACRKVFGNVHPDVITVDDTEHVNVPVKVVRAARDDLYIRPNEGQRKVYIFPRAADLNASGENALLKVMEEPPEYGAYILLANNPQQMLPTIRSRCVELSLVPLTESEMLPALQREFPEKSQAELQAAFRRSGGIFGAARNILKEGNAGSPHTAAFAAAYAAGNALDLTVLFIKLEKMKRDQLSALFEEWIGLLNEALLVRSGVPGVSAESGAVAAGRSGREILQAVGYLREARDRLRANANVGAVCGMLQIKLR